MANDRLERAPDKLPEVRATAYSVLVLAAICPPEMAQARATGHNGWAEPSLTP